MANSSERSKRAEQNSIQQSKELNPWVRIDNNSKSAPKKRHRAASQRVQIYHKPNFEVKLSNKFSALDKMEDCGKHKRQQKGPKQKSISTNLEQRNSSHHAADLPFPHRSLSFFTLDGLEEQIRVFHLTKYALPNLGKSVLHPANLVRADSFITPPRSGIIPHDGPERHNPYIPPHRHVKTPVQRVPTNSQGIFNPQDSSNDIAPPISIFGEDIEDAWNICKKCGIYVIWCGPKEDLTSLQLVKCKLQISGKYILFLRFCSLFTV